MSKVINLYARPWNKLEPKLKLKKINEFIKNNDDFTLNDKEKIKKFYSNKKKVKIDYDMELCQVKTLEILSA